MLHQLSLKQRGKMSVLGVSVAAHTAFWVQEVVQILLIHDHLLYALVDGIQSKGLFSYDWPVFGWTICPCPSHRGLWWVACIGEGDWGGTVPFSLYYFLLSICWWLPFLLQFYLLWTMTTSLLLITPTRSLSTHLIWHTYCALSQLDCGVSPFGLFLPRLLSFTADLLISAYTAYWSTWSVRQTY